MEDSQVFMYTVDEFLDLDDFENPVKTHLNGNYATILTTQYNWATNLFLRRNEYELNDDPLGYASSKKGYFYDLHPGFTMLIPSTYNFMFAFFIQVDSQVDKYKRNVMNISDIFGKLGGLFEVLDVSMRFFIIYFINKFMYSQLLSAMNQQDESSSSNK